MRNLTIVIGCGRLGASIANESFEKGENVTVIDIDKANFSRLSDVFGGFTLEGDATDLPFLEKAGIKDAKFAIITTGSDNTNLFLSHVIDKIYDVPYIYARFDDPEKKEFIRGFHVTGIYPFKLSFDSFNKSKEEL